MGDQKFAIGNQSGGRVFLFLHTDDFDRDYQNLIHQNIKIFREPSQEEYGKVCVFEDRNGNLWDLIEKNKKKWECEVNHIPIQSYFSMIL